MFTDRVATPKAVATAAVPKVEPSELERAINEVMRKSWRGLKDFNDIPWLVASGKEAASKKISDVIELLDDALNGDDHSLVKTMRVARNAILHIYHGVESREFHCMMQCACVKGGAHYSWPFYTAGCCTQGASDQSRIGAKLWDCADLLRLHHGYRKPRPVAKSIVYALKQLASELELKEESLEGEIKKIAQTISG